MSALLVNYMRIIRHISYLLFFVLLPVQSVLATDSPPSGEGGQVLGKVAEKVSFGGSSGGGDTPLPDLFTGAMSYAIPIDVPKGRNGMDPDLALSYSSRNGDGWVGAGWELEMGAIERSTRNGVDYNGDKFILRRASSSVELVHIGTGNEYQAKIENEFLRILKLTVAGSGGSGIVWQVTAKNGMQYYFGQTSVTRLHDPDNAAHEFKWCLDKIEDTNGNVITFSYFKDTDNTVANNHWNQIYLDHIDYGVNSIKFWREDRTDKSDNYLANFNAKTIYRLKAIDIVASGHRSKVVKLNYSTSLSTSRSILQSVQQFGSDALLDGSGNLTNESTAAHLPPVTIYTDNKPNGFAEQHYTLNSSDWGDAGFTWASDFDGDGKADIASASYGTIWVKHSQDDHFVEENWTTNAPTPSWGVAGYTWAGDFNGDGKTDIATASSGTIWVKHSLSDHFVEVDWTVNTPTPNWGYDVFTWAGDFDGDGKTDIATAYYGTIWVKHSLGDHFVEETWFANASTPNWGSAGYTWTGDFNGDGKTDIATAVNGKIYVKRSTDSSFVEEVWTSDATDWGDSAYTWVGDFNGDGKTDIATAAGGTIWAYLSTGSGFIKQVWATNAANWGEAANTRTGDFNGDGKTDIMTAYYGNIWVKRSTGHSFEEELWTSTAPNWGAGIFVRIGDFDGDGKADIASPYLNNIYVKKSTYFPVDLITRIDNGHGGSVSIEYTPSTTFSNPQLPFPIQTVKSIATNDGNGNAATSFFQLLRRFLPYR